MQINKFKLNKRTLNVASALHIYEVLTMMKNIKQSAKLGFTPYLSPMAVWSLSLGTTIGWGSQKALKEMGVKTR